MKKAIGFIDQMFENIAVIAYILAIIIMTMQIFSRYILQSPFMWAEEIARLLFVWIVYIGTAIAVKRHSHLVVDYFIQYLPQNIKRYLKSVLFVIAAIFCLIIAVLGMNMTINHMHMTINTMPITQAVWYFPIMIGFLMMAINFIRVLPEVLRGQDE